jgi:hypothetical protein
MEKTILYSFKGKSGDLLQDLFATMNRAFSSPTPGGLEGKSCLDVIDDAIRADAERTEHKSYQRLDAILDKQTERGIEENDPLADALERELRGEPDEAIDSGY